MSTSTINLRKTALQLKPAKVNKKMGDHSSDPFFTKKLDEAKNRLKKVTIPAILKGKK
ncbi:MAG: hypothetical protein J0H74_10315 [Chitinophagaceae bacterium]|nr:hypothetical protein [Chitinophagaceae bacterium]